MNNNITAELINTIEVGNELGEGVQWHIDSQLLLGLRELRCSLSTPK